MNQFLSELWSIMGYFLGALALVAGGAWAVFALVKWLVEPDSRKLVSWVVAIALTFFPLYIAFRPLFDAGSLAAARYVYLYDPAVGGLGAMISLFFILSSALVFIMRWLVISKIYKP